MPSDLERVQQWLKEAEEFARTYVFDMTDEYRAMIERVEAMPQNQSGVDKSGVVRGLRAYVEFFRLPRTVRRP